MQLSPSASTFQTLQTIVLTNEHKQPPARDKNVFSDWLMDSSAAGLAADWLAKIVASDVARVGDLMINGRDGAVLAPRVPPKA
ncbi:MAG TPA: hypothetical protein VL522_06135 [Bordetella sp.]|jgi:hypothetical protein|nr:hypothetical protein [Bordetella sp.]